MSIFLVVISACILTINDLEFLFYSVNSLSFITWLFDLLIQYYIVHKDTFVWWALFSFYFEKNTLPRANREVLSRCYRKRKLFFGNFSRGCGKSYQRSRSIVIFRLERRDWFFELENGKKKPFRLQMLTYFSCEWKSLSFLGQPYGYADF